MKNMISVVCILLAFVAYAKADIAISDNNETNLYELVNNYFDLGKTEAYTSSQGLYDGQTIKVQTGGTKRKPKYTNYDLAGLGIVNTETTWTTSDSTSILGVYRQATAIHDLSIMNGADKAGYWEDISGYDTLKKFSANDTPMWTADKAGDGIYFTLDTLFKWKDKNGREQETDTTWSSNSAVNADGETHMIAFDVTDLYNNKKLGRGDEEYESVFLFGWEDLYVDNGADWDYNDVVFLMANISANNPIEPAPAPDGNATPEPATLAILGLGLAGLGLIRRKKR